MAKKNNSKEQNQHARQNKGQQRSNSPAGEVDKRLDGPNRPAE